MSIMITCLGRTKEHNAEVGGVPTSYHVAENTPTGEVQAVDLIYSPDDTKSLHFAEGRLFSEWRNGLIDERLKIVVRELAMRMQKVEMELELYYQFMANHIAIHYHGVRTLIHNTGSGLHLHIEIKPDKGFEVELV